MEQLVEQMKKVLADTYALYVKAQYFHWNVEGDDFPMYHEFFGKIYEELQGAIDGIAEEIRTLDAYAPGSFKRFSELTTISDQTKIPPPEMMIGELHADNIKVLGTLMTAYKLAEQYNEIGLSNFIQDRYDAHKKHGWMLKASMEKEQ